MLAIGRRLFPRTAAFVAGGERLGLGPTVSGRRAACAAALGGEERERALRVHERARRAVPGSGPVALVAASHSHDRSGQAFVGGEHKAVVSHLVAGLIGHVDFAGNAKGS
jgi:hypothetical protein